MSGFWPGEATELPDRMKQMKARQCYSCIKTSTVSNAYAEQKQGGFFFLGVGGKGVICLVVQGGRSVALFSLPGSITI